MSTRIFALIAFIIAIIFFVVALIVNAATSATSIGHYNDIGFIAVAAGLALWCIEPVITRTPPQ
jgi:hypothetical protein